MVLRNVDETTVEKIIKSMPNKSSKDELSLWKAHSKKLFSFLTPALTTFFYGNEKLNFSRCQKHATVVSFHKGGDRENPSNFRPISLLPVVSKTHEKI